jgi:hypothetical protein
MTDGKACFIFSGFTALPEYHPTLEYVKERSERR